MSVSSGTPVCAVAYFRGFPVNPLRPLKGGAGFSRQDCNAFALALDRKLDQQRWCSREVRIIPDGPKLAALYPVVRRAVEQLVIFIEFAVGLMAATAVLRRKQN